MYYTYVLQNPKGKHYVGQTSDLEKRIEAHNEGKSPYTKGRGPWKIVYSEEYMTRSDAMKQEKFLKSGKGREFIGSKLKEKDL